mgnify:CR=1 FL=1
MCPPVHSPVNTAENLPKAKAKAKFDVYPSAYANGYMVQEYKRMGGKYKGATGGEVSLDPKKSDLDNDGKLSRYERKRGTAIAKSVAKKMNMGGVIKGRGGSFKGIR